MTGTNERVELRAVLAAARWPLAAYLLLRVARELVTPGALPEATLIRTFDWLASGDSRAPEFALVAYWALRFTVLFWAGWVSQARLGGRLTRAAAAGAGLGLVDSLLAFTDLLLSWILLPAMLLPVGMYGPLFNAAALLVALPGYLVVNALVAVAGATALRRFAASGAAPAGPMPSSARSGAAALLGAALLALAVRDAMHFAAPSRWGVVAWAREPAGRPHSEAGAVVAAGRDAEFGQLMRRGEEVYGLRCSQCHGDAGSGLPGTYPGLKSDPVALGPVVDHIDVVLHGRPGTAMVPFGATLTPAEVAAVVTFERNAWGNDGGDPWR